MKKKHVSVWFLIGLQLTIYGALIGAVSLYNWNSPPPDIVLSQLHAGVWLSLVMLVMGLVYLRKFWPRKN